MPKPVGGHLHKGLEVAGVRLCAVATSVLLQQPESEDQEAVVRELLHDHLASMVTEEELALIALGVLAATEKVRSLWDFTGKILPELDVESPEQQFALMKLLAQSYTSPNPTPEDREIESLQVLHVFNRLDGEHVAPTVPVTEKLEAGDFDTFIAREVLLVAAQPTEGPKQDGAAELEDFLQLSLRLSGKPVPETITELADSEMLALWPEAGKKALDLRRAQYRQNLRDVHTRTAGFIDYHDCIVLRNATEADIERAAFDFKVELAKQRVADTNLSMPQRLAARAIVESDKRKRRSHAERVQTVGSTATAAASPETPPTKTRTLAYITPSGEEAPEGSPAYEELFGDYLKAHAGQSGLEEDLATVREYLRTVDLSAGLPRGIYKLRGVPPSGLVRGKTCIPKVYQLKPSEAVGLSTSSEDGDKLRVLFGLRNGTVNLLGIETKANIATLQRNLGMRGRNNRK